MSRAIFKTKLVFIYIKCTLLIILTKDWSWCDGMHFLHRKVNTQSFFIDVYCYIMVKGFITWCNGIQLPRQALHWLIACHLKNCEVELISSWKQNVYCENTANNVWLIFSSKLVAQVARFLDPFPVALILLDFEKKVTKEVLSSSNDDPYSVWPVIFFLG